LLRLNNKDIDYRNKFIEKMANYGIATNVHYKPLPLLTAYTNLGFDINYFPNSYKQYENEITLPLHTLLSDEDIEYVVKCIKLITLDK
jgi:dTDP-4-amino-4,6-dideoxygalactose transaminase